MKSDGFLKVAKTLHTMNDVAIVFHKNPDGDAIGAATALFWCLKKLKKRCKVLSFASVPEKFEFLFEGCSFQNFDYRNVVAVDLASADLLEDELLGLKIDLVIDHHVSNCVESDFCFVDKTAAATCEIIFNLLGYLGVELDKKIAMSLYVGVATDTGCFKFSNTTSQTHNIAAKLLETGIDFSNFNHICFEMKTFNQLKLQSLAIQNLQFCHNNRCCFVVITREMFDESGCNEFDSFVVVSVVRSIMGVNVAIVLKQVDNFRFKASVRTVKGFSAQRFCEKLGGGGHELAAGFEIKSTADEINKKILEAVQNFLF